MFGCRLWPVVCVVAVLGLAACNVPATPQPMPTVRISEPTQGSTVLLNTEVPVRIEYTGPDLAQVYLWINGQRTGMLPLQPGGADAAILWTPFETGNHILYLEARDREDKVIARSDIVSVRVQEPASALMPTVMPAPEAAALPMFPPAEAAPPTPAQALTPESALESTPEPTAQLAQEQPTAALASPTPPSPPAATPLATPVPGLTVVAEWVNLRAGPGTVYDLLGRLVQGQAARVTGKSSDGQWWRISADGKVAWVSAQYVQANDAAAGVAVVQAPPTPLPSPTAAPAGPAVTEPASAATTPTSASTSVASAHDCNPSNPFWAATLNNAPDYTFCTPVPFEFVPNASPDPDEMVIRWHIYGDIVDLELRIDPSDDACGRGSTGLRQKVNFKEDNFRINRRFWPPGGYKIGLFATLSDGRVQDWGELHFCGK